MTTAHVISSATKYIQLDLRGGSVGSSNVIYPTVSFRFFLETMNYGQQFKSELFILHGFQGALKEERKQLEDWVAFLLIG